jgi:hypothetical protein
MKNALLLFSLVLFAQASFAQQNSEIDPRLVEYLGAENIATFQSEYPDKLAYYQHYLDNMIVVQDMGAKDISVYPNVSSIVKLNANAPDLNEQTDYSTINPFHYNFGNFGEQKIFRIGNSNLALIARPESFIRSEYLKQQGE